MITVFGCGIDVEELSRFEKREEDKRSLLEEDICSEKELRNFSGDKKVRLALSFCCKEAFFKSLGASWTNSRLSWKDIALFFDGPGLEGCRIELTGHADEVLKLNNARIGEIAFEVAAEIVVFQVVLLKTG